MMVCICDPKLISQGCIQDFILEGGGGICAWSERKIFTLYFLNMNFALKSQQFTTIISVFVYFLALLLKLQ